VNLWDALTASEFGSGELHCWSGSRYERTSWVQVSREAADMTVGLRNAGARPGSCVATILTNTPHAVRGLLGAWLTGAAVASFPVPARGMGLEEYGQQLTTLVDHLEPSVLLLDAGMIDLLPETLRERVRVRSWQSTADSGRVEPCPPGDDELAFVQYSSGSTSTPKGCALSTRAIADQIAIVAEMVNVRPGLDSCMTWLPLSHDMGLFGTTLTPWAYGIDLILSTPERFMLAPRTWFADVAESQATFTCGTNTALHIAARRHAGHRLAKRLNLRTVIIGAERLEWSAVTGIVDAFGPDGLTLESLMPAYGMAEATLAVTATPRLDPPRHIVVDGVALADGAVEEVEPDHPAATRVLSGGVACPGVELPGLETDALREITVRSPSLAMGYYGAEERTRERFRDGGFLTGDLGFARDEHVYPVGRMDDVISIAGRKVYAREIEAAVDGLDGVRTGCSTIVETHDGAAQRLTLLLELNGGSDDFDGLAEQAARLAMTKAAVSLHGCVFLEKGTLPKTPSGKIQRYRCRAALDAGELEPMATVELASA
jgi:fatty-acyl-CoA synthase